MSYGLLSGKYDSTRQRAVLLNGDRVRNFKNYTATLRLEMLLTGGIVLTDSQFFDGLYFFWLANDKNEFDGFKKCVRNIKNQIRNDQYIDVKCRYETITGITEKDSVAQNIYCKEFYNSSIEMKELAYYVFELSKDYTENIRHPENTLQDYIDNTKKYLTSLYGTNIAECWEDYGNVLSRLFSIDVGRWGYYVKQIDGSGNVFSEKWVKDFQIDKVLNQKIYMTPITYKEKLVSLLNDMEKVFNDVTAQKYYKRLELELNETKPNRSKIVVWLDEVLKLAENRGTAHSIKASVYEFKCILNDRYNKTFAIQHGCKFIDMSDYPKAFKNTNVIEYIVSMENGDISKLADMTWEQFYDLRTSLDVDIRNWIDEYDQFTAIGNENQLRMAFETYIDSLKTKLRAITVQPEKMEIDYIETVDENIYGYIIKKRGICFVGGGSYEHVEESKEICILCQQLSDTNNKTVVLRLCKDNEKLKDYDTMIAPVENIYNGGSLDV